VQVLHGEGVAIHTGPESCTGRREATPEALTGERIGQPLSDEIPIIQSADALVPAEGNMDGHAIASIRPTPRRLRPWHVRTSSAREPGGLLLGFSASVVALLCDLTREPQLIRLKAERRAVK
jgi:hypothetical protein